MENQDEELTLDCQLGAMVRAEEGIDPNYYAGVLEWVRTDRISENYRYTCFIVCQTSDEENPFVAWRETRH